jgi:hypothetical protein
MHIDCAFPGEPHTARSASVQPPACVGFLVGFAVVGTRVGASVGGSVGARVGHESVARTSSAEVIEPNDVVTYGIEAGIPFESVSSVPTSTCGPTPMGIIRSMFDFT